MEMILVCFPFIVSVVPWALAEYWKKRSGVPWLLLSFLPAYPLIKYNINSVSESIGGNPMGGTKAGIILFTSLSCALVVCLLVAFIPKKVKGNEQG